MDISAAIRANPAPSGIGELPRQRQEAVNFCSAALREGFKSTPPHTPFLAPKINEAPLALQGPTHKRATEAERSRQKRNDVKTSFLNTGQLALALLHYIIAGEIAGAWAKFGGLGALLTNLAA